MVSILIFRTPSYAISQLTGEFEFEEFRDFYIRYLDSDESLHFLREYAKHRFRDIEHEKRVRREQLERENRARRRAYLKIKYHDLVEAQKAKFRDNSIVDVYGNRRRLYHHRTKNPTLPTSDESETTGEKKKRVKNVAEGNLDTTTSNNTVLKTLLNNNNTSIETYNADNIHSIDEESFIEKGLNESGYGESQSLGSGVSDKSSNQGSVLLSNVVMKRRTVLAPLQPATGGKGSEKRDKGDIGAIATSTNKTDNAVIMEQVTGDSQSVNTACKSFPGF